MTTFSVNMVNNEAIRALRSEAAAAGDYVQVSLCDQALQGNDAARAECADVIAQAQG